MELGRQHKILDRDGQNVRHDLEKEFGHLNSPESLSQSRIAVQDLLQDLNVGHSG